MKGDALKALATKIIRRILKPTGLTIISEDRIPTWARFFDLLRRYGSEPSVIYDIGIADGTPELWSAFPQAELVLFDPLPLGKPVNRPHAFHQVALGDCAKEVTLNVRERASHSTLFDQPGRSDETVVPMRTFDEIVPAASPSSLCKIDVQGAELLVLKGMERALAQIPVMLIEVNLNPPANGPADFNSVHTFLTAKGFVLADVTGFKRRPFDGAIGQLDTIYVRSDHPTRRETRWR